MRKVQLMVDTCRMREKGNLYSLTLAMRHSQGTDSKVFRDFVQGLLEE